ncbi:MAG: NADH-quinone oxidoreductase subunit N [Nitrospirota bacterium]
MSALYQHIFSVLKPILPECILVGTGILALLAGLLFRKEYITWIAWGSFAGIMGAGITLVLSREISGIIFEGAVLSDPLAFFFRFFFILACSVSMLASMPYVRIEESRRSEYCAFLLFAAVGMMFLASAGDLITLYLAGELVALPSALLAGFTRENKSHEGAIKFLILHGVMTGVLIYGMSLVYGIAGTTALSGIQEFFEAADVFPPVMILGLIMMIAGLLFKIAAVPFHLWMPDLFEGAPLPVTAFLSAAFPAAGFAILIRIFFVMAEPFAGFLTILTSLIAVLSMAVGTIMALSQTNVKRMFTYLLIAHCGYAFIGFAAGGDDGIASSVFSICFFGVMHLAAYTAVFVMNQSGMGESISDFEGLGHANPVVALLVSVYLTSLAGVPPFAGFMCKFSLLQSALHAGLGWLAAAGLLFWLLGAYCCLRIVMSIYTRESQGSVRLPAPSLTVALWISALVLLAGGIYPAPLLDAAAASILPFF